MITGQEKIIHAEDTHRSSTIEMADITNPYDCVVIDEIQMIEDGKWGHAWTNSFLGVQAREIHLCGDEWCLELIK